MLKIEIHEWKLDNRRSSNASRESKVSKCLIKKATVDGAKCKETQTSRIARKHFIKAIKCNDMTELIKMHLREIEMRFALKHGICMMNLK